MLSRALILAAGRVRPIGDPDVPNALVPVAGVPLLLRWLRLFARLGVTEVGVSIGWQGERVRAAGEGMRSRESGLPQLSWWLNSRWDEPNGLSVLAAREFLKEPALLVMGDQIAAPHLLGEMLRLTPAGPRTVLAVDRDLSRVFDFDDATKIRLGRNGSPGLRVTAMSKVLPPPHDGVSAGLFVVGSSLLEALDELPSPSLTEGLHRAAERGLVDAHDVRAALWQDVDSKDMRLHAEWLLRVYGDELIHPDVRGRERARDVDTMALVDRLMAEKDEPRYTLFNPGPVMTSARVKAALVHYDTCHRDTSYSAVVRRLQTKLRPVFGASDAHEMLLLTGSGTAAMEMALASTVPPDGTLLTIENGAFGERLGEIARLHGMRHQALRYAWGELPDVAAVQAALDANPGIAVVAMIHHETSVGLMNPVGAVGRLCRERGVLLIVDAVSSLGVEELDVVRDGVDICYSSANKCLHSVSGVSFLCVAPHVWPRIEAIAPRVYYLDLKRYRRYLDELHQTPFTPAVSAFFALETAIDELTDQGGVPARRDVYRLRNLRIRRVLTDLGFSSFTNTGRESHTICTLRVPAGVVIDRLYEAMKDRGYIIYRCKGTLARDHIQVANMGELPDSTVDAFLTALSDEVRAQTSGQGVAAVGGPEGLVTGVKRSSTTTTRRPNGT